MSFTYRGLKAKLDRHIVTTEEIDRQMERLRQQNPRIALIDNRPTEQGDEVILDYAGFCDGEQFAGGTAQNQSLVLGSGMFIPGFEEQLLDKVPGEEVVVKVTFPTEYHAPIWPARRPSSAASCTRSGSRPSTIWTTPSPRKWAAVRPIPKWSRR